MTKMYLDMFSQAKGWYVIPPKARGPRVDEAFIAGDLTRFGYTGSREVCVTLPFGLRYYRLNKRGKRPMRKGFELLSQPQPHDTYLLKIREIEPGSVWVVEEEGNPGRITFLAADTSR